MEKNAPIAYFAYNRPEHTRLSLDSLKKNKLAPYSEIIIFSDGPKNNKQDLIKVDEVRSIISELKGFKKKKIIYRKKNYGLYRNFVSGITQVCNNYNKIIVVEDDNKTSKYFLNYINDGLNLYEKNNLICSINGWFYPGENNLDETFFLLGGNTWGWGTWKRAWKKYNPNINYLLTEIKNRNLKKKFNLNNSFDYYKMLIKRKKQLNESHTIIWKASTFLEGMYSLYPSRSLVKNIGFDGSGTNNKIPDESYVHENILDLPIKIREIKEVKQNDDAMKFINQYYRKKKIKTSITKLKKIFKFFGL